MSIDERRHDLYDDALKDAARSAESSGNPWVVVEEYDGRTNDGSATTSAFVAMPVSNFHAYERLAEGSGGWTKVAADCGLNLRVLIAPKSRSVVWVSGRISKSKWRR